MSTLVLLASIVTTASPGQADPASPAKSRGRQTIAEVEATINTLNRQAEIASEDLNTVRVKMTDSRMRLAALRADVHRQRTSVSTLRAQVVSATLTDYQNAGGVSTATAFLVADDPATFMTSLANDAVAEQQASGILTRLVQEQGLLAVREKQAQLAMDAVRTDRAQILEHETTLADKIREAKALLDGLKAKQRARLLALQQASEPQHATVQTQTPAQTQTQTQSQPSSQPSRDSTRTTTSSVPTSSRAQIAVDTALAQLGDPYVYGAAGPDAFDCSGLTMYAWAAAGVSLPHSSAMQPSSGTPIATSDLMPGDLVFYYSPISHVGMYIGNGQVVHAPHTGSYVQIVPLDSMPIAMAVRIG